MCVCVFNNNKKKSALYGLMFQLVAHFQMLLIAKGGGSVPVPDGASAFGLQLNTLLNHIVTCESFDNSSMAVGDAERRLKAFITMLEASHESRLSTVQKLLIMDRAAATADKWGLQDLMAKASEENKQRIDKTIKKIELDSAATRLEVQINYEKEVIQSLQERKENMEDQIAELEVRFEGGLSAANPATEQNERSLYAEYQAEVKKIDNQIKNRRMVRYD